MKLQLPVKLLFILFTMGLINACSVQKRHYSKGYHVSWKKQPLSGSITRSVSNSEKKTIQTPRASVVENNSQTAKVEDLLFASAQKTPAFADTHGKKKNGAFEGDSCSDKIIYKNGDELLVKIIEISTDVIAFRRCDHLDGPIHKISTAEVFMIKYANGTRQVFKNESALNTTPSSPARKPVKKKVSGFALASFILSFFFFLYLIPTIVSVIMGMAALAQFKKHPDEYKGKWAAVAGLIISFVILFLFLLIVITSI